jgi:molecular chaperone GrpE
MNATPQDTQTPTVPPTSEPPAPPSPAAEVAPIPMLAEPSGSSSQPSPEAATAPAAENDPILVALEQLKKKSDDLRAHFDEKLRYDAGREAVIDRLHEELQEYKADLVLKINKPLALEMIQIYDALSELIASRSTAGGEAAVEAKLMRALGNLQTDIEDALYRHGYEPFTTDQPLFDPRRQRVRKAVPADDPTRDKTIAERVRRGFRYEGKNVVRPEIVNVYVFQTPKQN